MVIFNRIRGLEPIPFTRARGEKIGNLDRTPRYCQNYKMYITRRYDCVEKKKKKKKRKIIMVKIKAKYRNAYCSKR